MQSLSILCNCGVFKVSSDWRHQSSIKHSLSNTCWAKPNDSIPLVPIQSYSVPDLPQVCCRLQVQVASTRKSHQKYPKLYHRSMQFWAEVPHILALESIRMAVWKSFQMIKGTASRLLMWLLQAKRGSLVKLPRTRRPSIPHRALLIELVDPLGHSKHELTI